MISDEELLVEIKKLNKQISVFTNPYKNALHNFSSGIWHSLGSLFGTVVIAAIIVYLFSRLNITETLTKYFQSLIPKPEINFTLPSSEPLPGQL